MQLAIPRISRSSERRKSHGRCLLNPALVTYPDDFKFVASRSSVQAQLRNSVLPLVAQEVIAAISGCG
jgi:site-specific DNA-cytosine methylase